MRSIIKHLGELLFIIGLFIFLGTPDFLSWAELFRQIGIAMGFMLVGLIFYNLEVVDESGN